MSQPGWSTSSLIAPAFSISNWVQARFESNPDVEEGRWQHRAADQESGRVPSSDDEDPLRQARSVLLGSERLGLIGRVDIIEGDGRMVRPVDAKKGRAVEWQPDPQGALEAVST